VLKKARFTISESTTYKPTTNKSINNKLDKPLIDDLFNNMFVIEKPIINEFAAAELVSEPIALKPISDQAIKPNIIELLETLRDALYRENTNAIIARSAFISPINKTAANRPIDSDLPIITYINRIAILNKYFPKPIIDLRPLNSIVAPN
jgi:hypothetical protein